MDTTAFIHHLTALPDYSDQISHIEKIVPREATHGELDYPLAEELQKCLDDNGFLPLYSHQAEAINHVVLRR